MGKESERYMNFRKMTDDQFIEKLTNKYGHEYRPLDRYINSNTKIRILHINCGQIILKRPNDILNEYECNICNKYHKKTNEEFKKELQEKYGHEYIILEEYTNSHAEIFFMHKCGMHFKAKPYMMLQGKRKCPKCKKNPTPTEAEIKEKIKMSKDGEEYLLVSNYEKMSKKAKFLHKVCEKTFLMKPTEFIVQEHRCPYCAINAKYTTETFQDEVLKRTGGGYLVLEKYSNNKTKISIKHIKCGNIWSVRPDAFLNGSRCPKCANSRANKEIKRYLKSNNINHITEYRIKECKNRKMLPFDFAILDDKNNIKLLIEYQGRQHYEVVEKFGGEEGFKERRKNDNIKSEYCKNNNIELLIIPYKEFKNINSILEQKLKAMV